MKKFFFTFGPNHETNSGRGLGRHFVVIESEHETKARQQMWDIRGEHWAFCYTEEEFAGQPEEYGLTCLTVEQVSLK